MSSFIELKEAIDEIGRTFEQFKAANDNRRDEEARKWNAELDRLCGKVARLETALKRPGLALVRDDERSFEMQSFIKALRYDTPQLSEQERKALTASDSTQGGYAAPTEFVAEVIKAVVEFSPIRALARVRRTAARSIEIPKRTGTFAAQWTSESGTRSETEGLSYGMEEIPTHEMYALADVSQQLLEDSAFDLESELQMEFSEQFGVAEATAFVFGNGVGKPEGFLTHEDVAETNSGSAASIADANGQADGLIDLLHAVKAPYAASGTWLLNRTTLASVRKLKDGNGQYIWQPGLAQGAPNTILGRPYAEATDMPDEGANTVPIAFGDIRRAYTIVDRISMSVLRDPFTQQAKGRVRFHARRRVGGQVVLAEAVRKLKCAV